MIASVSGRDRFARLSRDGKRYRSGTLWCSWCPDPTTTTCSVAFAIGRASGTAVARNRLRRRLREIVRELDRRDPFPPGLLLLGLTPTTTAELTFDRLRNDAAQLRDQLAER